MSAAHSSLTPVPRQRPRRLRTAWLRSAAASGAGVLVGAGALVAAGAALPVAVLPAAQAATPTYGALPLGTARYAIPSGARYVSPSGSDSASGTSTAPYRTLAKAVAAAPAGSTVVMRAGTYRESVTWYGKRLTVQNYPGEKVWLSGSDPVSGWVTDGSAFRKDGWTASFKRGSSQTDPAHPLAAYPDMLFLDGVAQRQVASRSAVVAGTFYLDDAADRLYAGTDPRAHQAEASTRTRGIYVNRSDGSVVRGIGIDHYANHPDDLGALLIDSAGVTVENCVVQQNAAMGVSVLGHSAVVTRTSITDNGQIGLHANRADGLRVDHDLLQHNDTEQFAITGAEGNLKVTSTARVVATDNLVRYSGGRGLWFDIDTTDLTLVRNVIADNADRGLQVELSARAVVAGNLLKGNGSDGLSVLASQDVQVYNNSFWLNTRAVYVVNDARRAVQAVTIRNNIMSSSRPGTNQILGVEDVTRQRTAAAMGVTADDDAYAQVGGNAATWWFGWADYPRSYPVFSSLAQFRSRTGQEGTSVGLSTSGADPFFTSPASGDFSIKAGSPSSSVTPAPLPASVAAALGTTTGSRPPLGAALTSSLG